MIVALRGKVRSWVRRLPGDELVTDHVRGQLLRRVAVRRDDPATRLAPLLFPSGHDSLQSCGLRDAKMERVSEVLQLPVVVEGTRPLALELQPLEKLDFLRGRRAAERRIPKEFLEPRLFHEVLFGFQFDKLKLLNVPSDQSVV